MHLPCRLSGVEAVKEQVKKELELLEEEAKQLDELGHHKEAGMMRTTARRLRGEIDMPPQAGDASAAQTSGKMRCAFWSQKGSGACAAAVLLCHACISTLSANMAVPWSPSVERRLHQTLP